MKGFIELLKTTRGSSLELIIWSIFIGIVLASLLALYEKRYIGAFVRALLSQKANSPESAKSLSELGFKHGALIKMAMKGKSALSTVVFLDSDKIERAEREGKAQDGEPGEILPIVRRDFDIKTARFYIPDERADHAAIRFDQKGTHVMAVVVAAAVFALIAALAVRYLPEALGYLGEIADNIFN